MKTNTKNNVLKLAMTIVAMLIFTGATGQILTEYTETNGTDMYQTQGTNFRIYVDPDRVYSPDYTSGDNTGINPNSYWQFILSGGLTAVTPGDIASPVNQNWVEVTASTTGAQTISAAESFGAAGCVGSTQLQNVYVLPAPTAVLTGSGSDPSWTEIVAGHEYMRCSPLALGDAENLIVAFTETGVPTGMANYAYSIDMEVTGYDVNGTEVVGPTTTTPINHPLTDKVAGGADDGGSNSDGTGALNYVQYDPGTGLEDVRTKYVFTLNKAGDAPGAAAAGIVSQISHKSDFEGGTVNTYAFSSNTVEGEDYLTVTYWINLPPVTGPIYHIPNNHTF